MSDKNEKPQNPFTGLLINVVIPVVVLTVFSKEKYLGPLWGLVTALVLPIGYGLHALIWEKRCDPMSILGTVSVLLTGIFGVLELPPKWMIWKETLIPFFIGVAIVVSLKTPFPLIKKLLMSETLFDVKLLKESLREKGNEELFEKRLVGLTWGLASSMFLSAVLNYILASIMLKSEPGSAEYAAEIGKMTGISYVVILIPCMTIMVFVFNALCKTLTTLTGHELDDILADAYKAKPKEPVPEADQPE